MKSAFFLALVAPVMADGSWFGGAPDCAVSDAWTNSSNFGGVFFSLAISGLDQTAKPVFV